MTSIIKVEHLSKRYFVGHQLQQEQYTTIRDVIASRAKTIARKGRDLFLRRQIVQGDEVEEFWALKDVSFEIEPGAALGIIGRNGAGKSTLLKILSRITEPTAGKVVLRGRVASLLEVGTGFHSELTGRENIFLNGAILGMSRAEIKRKFDEIVDFAEVAKFLDTPVKHYSSGMYVKLAFAVAAHLEPEILIVDEVLAVGDIGFQKKCLGRMRDVATGGRTVLFVSHNMQSIAALTSQVLLLKNGSVAYSGNVNEGIAEYSKSVFDDSLIGQPYQSDSSSNQTKVVYARVLSSPLEREHFCGEDITFEFDIDVNQAFENLSFSFQILDESNRSVCYFWLTGSHANLGKQSGIHRIICHVPKFSLYIGKYTLTTWLNDRKGKAVVERLSEICPFQVSMGGRTRDDYPWEPNEMVYLQEHSWSVRKN